MEKYKYGIKPYIDALFFFAKIDSLSKNYEKIYKKNINPNLKKKYSLEVFINNFIEENLYNSKNKEELDFLLKNPDKIFCYLLDNLNEIFREKKNDVNENIGKINPIEYEDLEAKQLFNSYMERNKSEITELFFGSKQIEKFCTKCQLSQYLYKYLKVIPLKILEAEENHFTLDSLLPQIEEKFNQECFCSMCSSDQNFNVRIKVSKKPKILIIIILNNNDKVVIDKEIYNGEYQLIGAEITNNYEFGIFDFFLKCKFRNKQNNNQILYKEKEKIFQLNRNDKKITDTKIKHEYPYVLFYKRNDDIKDIKEINNNSSEDVLISNAKDENPRDGDDKEEILLYFTFKSNGKEIFIDTNECKTFSEIVTELKKKYDWAKNIIDENKLYFNNKKINCHQTPKQLGIKDESTIFVEDL